MAKQLGDFLAEETPKKPHIIGRGILPKQGKLVLGGAPKANKSFTAIAAALSLTRGEPLFRAFYKDGSPVFPVTRPWTVLYLDQELGEDGFRQRLVPMVEDKDIINPFFLHTKDTAMQLDTPEGVTLIEKEIEQVQPEVLILDPLAKFHSADENSAQEMGRVLKQGDAWIEKYGLSIVYIHHTGLAAYDPTNGRRGGARLRGSSAVFADVDTVVEVLRKSAADDKEPTLQLGFELRQGEPIRNQYIKRLPTGQIVYVGENQWTKENQ